ncbi:hypothetical protein PGT21_029071 [Puccinia graminis f. sp. tritici]|uniref:Uncharacterized protein n=1 Tax=Puccinia graminis f. sp. tritici TaxID=56615 RepID=A0A5B0PLA0_PUCGR|nr:hypothetical protein PGT21_029071 [Puccinia graminis f. sp. tritici]KAA1136237.1 hypothetical protein PGTUg99_008937 [Puccinia graminis f. sp. tritici]
MRIKDPTDLARSMRVTRDGLFAWSCALVHKSDHVSLVTPPATKEFVLEAVTVYTLAELKAKDGRGVSRALTNLANNMVTPAAVKYSKPWVTASGRIRPPKILPAEAAMVNDPAFCTPPGASAPQEALTDVSLGHDTGSCDLDGATSDAAGMGFEDRGCGTNGRARRVNHWSSSTDLEVISGVGGTVGLDRLLARKIPRSPAGGGIAHTISRLDFNNHCCLPVRLLARSQGLMGHRVLCWVQRGMWRLLAPAPSVHCTQTSRL